MANIFHIVVIILGVASQTVFGQETKAQKELSVFPFIVGGEFAESNEFPFLVALYNKDLQPLCAGTILRPNWILTASHCVKTGLVEYVSFAPKGKLDQDTRVYAIDTIYNHPNFTGLSVSSDIALIKLKKPIENATPICITSAKGSNVTQGTKLTTIGWGQEKVLPDNSTTTFFYGVKKIQLIVYGTTSCALFSLLPSSDEYICATHKRLEGVGQGDDGGPILVKDSTTNKWKQIGVTSTAVGDTTSCFLFDFY